MKKRMFLNSLLIVVGGALILALPWIYIRWKTQSLMIPSGGVVPPAPVAIVFGAGLNRDGTPQPVLADRVQTAVDLYKNGTVRKILMSGDNRFLDYNEPEAMRQLALELGVPDSDIAMDYAGRRTYDSCYRARYVFDVKKAILVTQAYHLPRALYICNALGVDSVGVPADRRTYRTSSMISWQLREWAASYSALLDLYILHPQPVLGPLEPL